METAEIRRRLIFFHSFFSITTSSSLFCLVVSLQRFFAPMPFIYHVIYSCFYLKHRSIASDLWCPHQPTLPADTEQELLSLKRKEGGKEAQVRSRVYLGRASREWGVKRGRGGYIHTVVSGQPQCDGLSPAARVMCSYEC